MLAQRLKKIDRINRYIIGCLALLTMGTSSLTAAELQTLEDNDIERSSAVSTSKGSNLPSVPLPRQKIIMPTPASVSAAPVPRNKAQSPITDAKVEISTASIPVPRAKPDDVQFPPSPFATGLISKTDQQHYIRAFKHLSKFQWQSAIEDAEKAYYQLPAKYIRWRWLRAYKGGASFEEIANFVIDNPNWPYRETLMRRAEEALINPISADRTLSWFTDRTPLTGMGMLRLGEALLSKGQTDKGHEWIKKAWHEGNFSAGLEKKFLKQHKALLTLSDHETRLDNQLWNRQAVDAIRMLDRVSVAKKKLAIARIRLMRMSRNVDAALQQIPQELMNDPGLVFDRAKWRRRKGRHEEARELLLNMGDDVPHAEIWWPEREIQARKLLRLGHISEAYRLSKNHGLTSGGKFASAEWLAGWIALRFLHEYDGALAHFTRLYENVSYPISRSRGAYWIARSYAAMKDDASAKYWFEEATRYSSTFYGQVAMSEIGLKEAPELKRKSSFDTATAQSLNKNELVMVVRHLAELDQNRYARPFLLKLTEDATSPQEYVFFGKLAADIGRQDFAVAVAKRASQLGTELPDISWPTHTFFPDKPAIEKPLILAITRQESAFASDAISRAGARGLMQLMPRTARDVSRKLKISYGKSKLNNDPAYNTLLGSTYLGGLIDRFDGSYILAIASYNAGSSRIRDWMQDWGDPRLNEIDTLDWIELIPFSETRNYVQRVMENLQVYRQLLNDEEIKVVQIGDDLVRGNPTN